MFIIHGYEYMTKKKFFKFLRKNKTRFTVEEHGELLKVTLV